MPKRYLEQVGDDGFKKHPIGLGPYKFVSHTPGIDIVLEAYEGYWRKVPHLKRKPSEYIRDHIWWTTQPMEDPERREHLFETIEWIGWDKLLFATDYPHWDFDEPSRVLPAGVSDANREAFYLGNAKKLYGIS